MVKHLPNTCEALGPILNTSGNKIKGENNITKCTEQSHGKPEMTFSVTLNNTKMISDTHCYSYEKKSMKEMNSQ